MKRNFENKVVIVTGVCGGLGRALAMRFVKAKAKVIGTDVDNAEIQKLNEEGLVDAYWNDVTDEKAIQQLVDTIVEKYQGIDLIINNAGISHFGKFHETDLSVLCKVMNINFFGSLYWTRKCIPHLINNKGMVICISSVAGYGPLFARTAYSASKHALHGCFESMRVELEPLGVDVMLVCPAFIDTKIDKNALSENGETFSRKRLHAGKMMTPESVADKIFVCATKSKKLVLVGWVSHVSFLLNKISKQLYAYMMKQKFSKEAK